MKLIEPYEPWVVYGRYPPEILLKEKELTPLARIIISIIVSVSAIIVSAFLLPSGALPLTLAFVIPGAIVYAIKLFGLFEMNPKVFEPQAFRYLAVRKRKKIHELPFGPDNNLEDAKYRQVLGDYLDLIRNYSVRRDNEVERYIANILHEHDRWSHLSYKADAQGVRELIDNEYLSELANSRKRIEEEIDKPIRKGK